MRAYSLRRAVVLIGLLPLAAGPWGAAGAQTFPENPPLAAPTPIPGEEPGSGADHPGVAPIPDDPTITAGGALNIFMASRNYRTIRALKAVMTPALVARYNRNSTPFNGKQRIRMVAFDFEPGDLKPVKPKRGQAPVAYRATARSLWAEQCEAVVLRRERMRVAQQEDGLWRVGTLKEIDSESLRFMGSAPGIIELRKLMRAWCRRSLEGARRLMSPTFLKKFEGREEALQAIFVGEQDPRHVAYRILELNDEVLGRLGAQIELYETSPGRPMPIEGSPRLVRLVKRGSRWSLNDWQ